jgi:predicted RNA-binding Zn-ribbon protein involved in translation (DUF1610 family)
VRVTGALEIRCPACGGETLLRREPVYDGFRKTGEKLSCSECGHVFPDETQVPFIGIARPKVFSEGDRPAAVRVFDEAEQRRCCRHCRHYVVNPFLQRCGLHHREVEATDLCDDFSAPTRDDGENEKG